MKTMVKFVMLLTVLAICLPAQGQVESSVLIYSKSLKCWEANEGEGWDVTNEIIRGFLVLEVVYDEDGTIDEIIRSVQVEYGRNGKGDKVYTEVEHGFGVVRVVDGSRVEWVFVELSQDMEGGELTMVRGRAKDSRIGNADPNEVAPNLSGNHQGYWNDEGFEDLIMCEWLLRLQESWTRWTNEDGDSFDDALDNIEIWLEDRGYIGDR